MEDSLIQYREEEKFFSLKSYYIFEYKIEQVWKIISHPAKLMFVLGEWVDKTEYIEDDLKKDIFFEYPMKFKINSILNFRWKSIFECGFEVKEIVETEFYKKIFFDSYTFYPFQFKYQVIYNLYWNSDEENTLFIHELICEVNNRMFSNDQEQNLRERQVMFNKVEELLYNDLSVMYQEEGIILDINLNELWRIVTDWRIFKEYVPQICLEITYNGDPCRIGTEMKIINYGKNKNGYTKLRVFEIIYKENKNNNKTSSDFHINNSINESLKNTINQNNSEKSERNTDEINKVNGSENHEFYKSNKGNNKEPNENSEGNYSKINFKDYDECSIKEYTYVLECYEGVPKCPLQLLIFKFIKVSNDKSLLIFRHEFKQPVKHELIRNIGIEKKKILIDFRQSIKYHKTE